jgi:hypothetical protein
LHEHESKANRHAVANALLEQLYEMRFLALPVGTASLDLRADLAHLMMNVRMRAVKAANVAQDPLSPLKIVIFGQVPRRFRTPSDSEKQQDTGN